MSSRELLKAVRRSLSRVIEVFWHCGFLAVGWLVRSRAQPWTSSGNERVLVIAPHPDDEAIACSGTILRHLASGDNVLVAIATDGRNSRVASSPEEMARIRKNEATQAARRLGIGSPEWLGLPEGEWQVSELQPLLTGLLQRYRPTLVYAPSRIDFHPEHFAVAHTLGRALEAVPIKPRVRVYQVQVPLTRVLTNVVADVSGVIAQSETVLQAYKSQAGSIQCTYRRGRYGALSHRTVGPVEEFWELTAHQYSQIHRRPPVEWADRFRGLRPFAWTDPLAYLIGNRARRRLRALVPAQPSVGWDAA
jgi:LmbE family N-acetylglucosaminyl deacetylase